MEAPEEITVNMGMYEVRKTDCVLICLGIGSCIALVIYDHFNQVYGMAHVMLPEYVEGMKTTNTNKYANIAIPNMINDMVAKGAEKGHLKAKMAGGAHMFASVAAGETSISTKNVNAVRKALENERIPLAAEDTGGNMGRTIRFDTTAEEFKIIIRSKGTEKVL